MIAGTQVRRYRSDDRDFDDGDNDLMVYSGGNGDWYLTIVPHGHRIGPTVRVRTSGGPPEQPLAGVGVAQLWHALAFAPTRQLSMFTGNDQPWSLREVLKKLVHAADILLDDHQYDGHGWESIHHARAAGRRYLLGATQREEDYSEV